MVIEFIPRSSQSKVRLLILQQLSLFIISHAFRKNKKSEHPNYLVHTILVYTLFDTLFDTLIIPRHNVKLHNATM